LFLLAGVVEPVNAVADVPAHEPAVNVWLVSGGSGAETERNVFAESEVVLSAGLRECALQTFEGLVSLLSGHWTFDEPVPDHLDSVK
jgi:hypothetical protein